ncbi:hypothetical protein AJ79_10045 [Helicocarpus griseus UAMH5409]|uniref:Myb-like domain-containing protein n=1 Tax=Helicocarpus griseus UAMH5409 TaxID=1447875 RepID=A0A2B7WFH7_9EURO|nr:hypothetical protein AJ79_10045 [Helicocarpus griseus UAMH5409]
MHGKWTPEEDIFIVALRLGTRLNWKEIEAEFNKRFNHAKSKDLESRYNKGLKPGRRVAPDKRRISDIIDDYRHYKVDYEDPKERDIVRKALLVLSEFPDQRLWHSEIELLVLNAFLSGLVVSTAWCAARTG